MKGGCGKLILGSALTAFKTLQDPSRLEYLHGKVPDRRSLNNVQPKTRASGRTTERLASFERHWLALAASVWRRWRRLAAFQTLLRNSGIASNLRDAQPEKRPDFSAQRRAIIDGHNLLRQGRRTLTPSTRSPHGARSSGEALTNFNEKSLRKDFYKKNPNNS